MLDYPFIGSQHRRYHGIALLGNRVINGWRRIGKDLAFDDIHVLEQFQMPCEHGLRNRRQSTFELVEPLGTVEQLVQDQKVPSVPEYGEIGINDPANPFLVIHDWVTMNSDNNLHGISYETRYPMRDFSLFQCIKS